MLLGSVGYLVVVVVVVHGASLNYQITKKKKCLCGECIFIHKKFQCAENSLMLM
jgi:hypothetical protein